MNLFELKDFKIELNTIGDKDSRKAYNEALVKHFTPVIDDLCDDCKRRLQQNPLRILDCKRDYKHESIINAPFNYEYLNDESKAYYANVKEILNELNIPFVENHRMVRGLDYYSHTVFEFISTNENMGSQSTILGGGHYDYLVEQFGGPSMGAVGFGLGVERFLLALEAEGIDLGKAPSIDSYILVLDEEARTYAQKVATLLRVNQIATDMNMEKRSMKSQFKTVERLNAPIVLLIGNTEKENNTVTIKNTINQKQETVEVMKAVEVVNEMMKDNLEGEN